MMRRLPPPDVAARVATARQRPEAVLKLAYQ
jgi:hypothetical protein